MKLKLNDIEKKEFYKVPERYFNDLPMRIQAAVDEKSTPLIIFRPVMKWAIPAAASLIIALFFWMNPFEESTPPQPEVSLEEISEEELLYYLEDQGVTSTEIISVAYLPSEMDEILYEPTIEDQYILEEGELEDIQWFIEQDSNLNFDI